MQSFDAALPRNYSQLGMDFSIYRILFFNSKSILIFPKHSLTLVHLPGCSKSATGFTSKHFFHTRIPEYDLISVTNLRFRRRGFEKAQDESPPSRQDARDPESKWENYARFAPNERRDDSLIIGVRGLFQYFMRLSKAPPPPPPRPGTQPPGPT